MLGFALRSNLTPAGQPIATWSNVISPELCSEDARFDSRRLSRSSSDSRRAAKYPGGRSIAIVDLYVKDLKD